MIEQHPLDPKPPFCPLKSQDLPPGFGLVDCHRDPLSFRDYGRL